MKKTAFLLLIIMMLSTILTSCNIGGATGGGSSGGDGGETALPDPDDEECVVFRPDRRAIIITSPTADRDSLNAISAAVKATFGYTPLMRGASFEPEDYEIVLGDTDREITAHAYEQLDRMQDKGVAYLRYLVYAEGRSIAVVCDPTETKGINIYALTYAIEKLVRAYFTEPADKVAIPHGVVHAGYVNLLDEQAKIDNGVRDRYWEELKAQLKDRERGDEIYKAIESLYTVYDPAIAVWIAGLYEPYNCFCGECKKGELACYGGGFYYSNSARDNYTVNYGGVDYRLMADAESTLQALNLLSGAGITSSANLPSWMKEQIVTFIRELQDENGFFYHPQWPKSMTDKYNSRRARDLSWCTSILSTFGSLPKYDAPNGVRGEESLGASARVTSPMGASAVTQVSKVVLTASYGSHLENDETLRAYLANYLPADAKPGKGASNGFYWIGNNITAQMSEIKTRDKQLKAEGADYSLVDIVIEWFTTYQNTETGHWSTKENYAGTNGLLKISGIYTAAGKAFPNADAAARSAINAITSDEGVGAVVDIYNTWFAANNIISNIKTYGTDEVINGVTVTKDERLAAIRDAISSVAPEAIKATRDKISLFKKADGSFSYLKKMSSNTSQSMPVAIYGTNEGDVNATIICTTGIIGNMFSCLSLSRYPKICYGVDKVKFNEIIWDSYENP